jgi:hypothetical protein
MHSVPYYVKINGQVRAPVGQPPGKNALRPSDGRPDALRSPPEPGGKEKRPLSSE